MGKIGDFWFAVWLLVIAMVCSAVICIAADLPGFLFLCITSLIIAYTILGMCMRVYIENGEWWW